MGRRPERVSRKEAREAFRLLGEVRRQHDAASRKTWNQLTDGDLRLLTNASLATKVRGAGGKLRRAAEEQDLDPIVKSQWLRLGSWAIRAFAPTAITVWFVWLYTCYVCT